MCDPYHTPPQSTTCFCFNFLLVDWVCLFVCCLFFCLFVPCFVSVSSSSACPLSLSPLPPLFWLLFPPSPIFAPHHRVGGVVMSAEGRSVHMSILPSLHGDVIITWCRVLYGDVLHCSPRPSMWNVSCMTTILATPLLVHPPHTRLILRVRATLEVRHVNDPPVGFQHSSLRFFFLVRVGFTPL